MTQSPSFPNQPISTVQWVDRAELEPNDYNPNVVAPPELELLIISILEDGWTQPIVVQFQDAITGKRSIIDGFHRFTVSADPRLFALTNGFVPIVSIALDNIHRQMSTIRHNRARGTHRIMPMAEIVRGFLDAGLPQEEIETRLGMEDEEVIRLNDRLGMPDQIAKTNTTFGNAWVPQARP